MSWKYLVEGAVWVNSIPEIPGIPERGNSTDEGQRWEEHGEKLVSVGAQGARGSTCRHETTEVGREGLAMWGCVSKLRMSVSFPRWR